MEFGLFQKQMKRPRNSLNDKKWTEQNESFRKVFFVVRNVFFCYFARTNKIASEGSTCAGIVLRMMKRNPTKLGTHLLVVAAAVAAVADAAAADAAESADWGRPDGRDVRPLWLATRPRCSCESRPLLPGRWFDTKPCNWLVTALPDWLMFSCEQVTVGSWVLRSRRHWNGRHLRRRRCPCYSRRRWSADALPPMTFGAFLSRSHQKLASQFNSRLYLQPDTAFTTQRPASHFIWWFQWFFIFIHFNFLKIQIWRPIDASSSSE